MRLDLEQAWVGFLLLLACSWVTLCEENSETVRLSFHLKIMQTGTSTTVNSNILEKLADFAAKNQVGAIVIKGVKGLDLEDIRLPNLTVSYLPNEGATLPIISEITDKSKSILGDDVKITANVSLFCDIKQNTEKEIVLELEKCKVSAKSYKSNLPSRLKEKDIRPPIVSVGYVPNEGKKMLIKSHITIAGKSFLDGNLEITVASSICDIKQNAKKELKLEKCKVAVKSYKSNLPSSLLPKRVKIFLNSPLAKVLPSKMSPAAEEGTKMMEETISSSLQSADIEEPVEPSGPMKEVGEIAP